MRLFRVVVWLAVLGALNSCWATAQDASQAEKKIRAAVFDDQGVGASLKDLIAALEACPRITFERLSAEDVRAGKLADFDVLIQPGGGASKQAQSLEAEGRAVVRKFVQQGGGYVGFCAGAYLASCDYDWSLGILDAKVLDKQHWNRGFGEVRLTLTPTGRTVLGADEKVSIYYHQGPLLASAENPQIPDYEALAFFETEIAKNGATEGVMRGTTAVARGRFGQGRVFCFSPHPEKTAGLASFVHRAVCWAADQPPPETAPAQPAPPPVKLVPGPPVALFDGATLNGWTTQDGKPVTKGWTVEDGALFRKDRGGHIYSTGEYENFELSFEWKIAKNGNSGLKYHVRKFGNQWLGREYQLFDDQGRKTAKQDAHSAGALYALYGPNEEKELKPVGEYNTARIVARGTHIEHWLNGRKIVEVDTSSDDWRKRVSRSKFSDKAGFEVNGRGRIMLQDHGGQVWIRKLVLVPLEPAAE